MTRSPIPQYASGPVSTAHGPFCFNQHRHKATVINLPALTRKLQLSRRNTYAIKPAYSGIPKT